MEQHKFNFLVGGKPFFLSTGRNFRRIAENLGHL